MWTGMDIMDNMDEWTCLNSILTKSTYTLPFTLSLGRTNAQSCDTIVVLESYCP